MLKSNSQSNNKEEKLTLVLKLYEKAQVRENATKVQMRMYENALNALDQLNVPQDARTLLQKSAQSLFKRDV